MSGYVKEQHVSQCDSTGERQRRTGQSTGEGGRGHSESCETTEGSSGSSSPHLHSLLPVRSLCGSRQSDGRPCRWRRGFERHVHLRWSPCTALSCKLHSHVF